MAWTLVWSATARARLLKLTDWLARRNPAAALRFVDQLEADIQVLVDHPEIGPLWSHHPELGVRRLRSRNDLVDYELLDDACEVLLLTVRHARERPLTPQEAGGE